MLLLDGYAMRKEFPQSFTLPTAEQITSIGPGTFLKVSSNFERFWVCVSTVHGDNFSARIDNDLIHPINGVIWKCGDLISLHSRHVFDVQRPEIAEAVATALALYATTPGSGRVLPVQVDRATNRPQTGVELFRRYLSHTMH